MQEIVVSVLFQSMDHVTDDSSIDAKHLCDLLRGIALLDKHDQAIPVYNFFRHGHSVNSDVRSQVSGDLRNENHLNV